MPRVVKCRECGVKEKYDEDIFDVLIHVTSGGNEQKRFVHKKCIDDYMEKIKEKERENEELDKLSRYIAKVHGLHDVSIIPSTFFHLIQDVRNGTSRYTPAKRIRYKEGVSYPDIMRAYQLSETNIIRARHTKSFKSVQDEMKYCFAIARNTLPDVMREKKWKSRLEKSESDDQVPSFEDEREIEYRKKKDNADISDFLD